MALDAAHISTIITAAVGALGMWGAHLTAARAARKNAKEQAELEAYARARAMDERTIARQKEQNDELIKENKELRLEVAELRRKVGRQR